MTWLDGVGLKVSKNYCWWYGEGVEEGLRLHELLLSLVMISYYWVDKDLS